MIVPDDWCMETKRKLGAWVMPAMLVALLTACGDDTASLNSIATLPVVPTMVRAEPRRVSTVVLTPTVLPDGSPTLSVIPPTDQPDAVNRQSDVPLYARPAAGSNVIQVLPAQTELIVIGRMENNRWLQVVAPSTQVGWVPLDALDVNISLDTISITAVIGEPLPTVLPPGRPTGRLITGITPRTREIFEEGQRQGNRAGVFSKIGDSITVASYVLYPIGWGVHDLQQYAYLDPVIQHFKTETANDSNSFSNTSLAADNGWTTDSVLDTGLAHHQFCHGGETPLECEFRILKPALALILLGTNDVELLSAAEYRQNLRRIMEISISRGIIPVVSTIPDRLGFETQVIQFNAIVHDLTREFQTPLWDYAWAMSILPNSGLSQDGVHPSWPPGDIAEAARFSPQNLQYGYTARNLTALQVLDAVWRQVIKG